LANRTSSPCLRGLSPRGKYGIECPLPSLSLAEPEALIGHSGAENTRFAFRTIQIDGLAGVIVQGSQVVADVDRIVRKRIRELPIHTRCERRPQQHRDRAPK
jgi:hypothetical protein